MNPTPLAAPDPATTAWVPIWNASGAVTAPAECAFLAMNGPAVAISGGVWTTLPIPATPTYSTPAGAFTRNADGSVTVRDAGLYSLKATVFHDGYTIGGAGGSTAIFASTPNDWQGGLGAILTSLPPLPAGQQMRFGIVGDLQLTAGAKIFVNVALGANVNANIGQFAISRIAVQGQQGATGPPGPGVPQPVVNGQWIKGVGGAAVWAPLTVADVATQLPACTIIGNPNQAIPAGVLTNPVGSSSAQSPAATGVIAAQVNPAAFTLTRAGWYSFSFVSFWNGGSLDVGGVILYMSASFLPGGVAVRPNLGTNYGRDAWATTGWNQSSSSTNVQLAVNIAVAATLSQFQFTATYLASP